MTTIPIKKINKHTPQPDCSITNFFWTFVLTVIRSELYPTYNSDSVLKFRRTWLWHNSVCGDSIVVDPEQCDDGNTLDSDSCNNQYKSQSPPVSAGAVAGLVGAMAGLVLVAGIVAAVFVSKGKAAGATTAAVAGNAVNDMNQGHMSAENIHHAGKHGHRSFEWSLQHLFIIILVLFTIFRILGTNQYKLLNYNSSAEEKDILNPFELIIQVYLSWVDRI